MNDYLNIVRFDNKKVELVFFGLIDFLILKYAKLPVTQFEWSID